MIEKIGLGQTSHILKPNNITNSEVKPIDVQKKFSKALMEALNNVNDSQVQSDQITTKFIKGEVENIHDVMIAAQKASVTRIAAVEVRDKVIEAYKEIMRMGM